MKLFEMRKWIAATEGLTGEDIQEMTPNGREPKFAYNIRWAASYLEKSGLLMRVSRGVFRLTEEGGQLLARKPNRIDKKLLEGYPRYVEWMRPSVSQSSDRNMAANSGDGQSETPEEELARAVRQIHGIIEADILHRIQSVTPLFLKRVVVDLLIAMGYGGEDPENGRVTLRTSDGGIDGTIREDALGLNEVYVYVQAKKYSADHKVGEGDLRNFAGAIDATNANKGVFVTTSAFTKSAVKYAGRSPKRIILIDGEKLTQLMIRHGVGVCTWQAWEVKRVDEDYFGQETM